MTHTEQITRIVDTIDELTPEWFTSALRQGGTIREKMTVIAARNELLGSGQLGMVVRSELTYDRGGTGADQAPGSVVVKLPAEDPTRRQTGVAMGLYESEIRFYKEIAPRAGIAVPRLHWADLEPNTGRMTLVIDDLTDRAEVGDMIARATPEQAELAFGELAKLHASLWNNASLRELRWLADPARAQMLFDSVPAAVEPFKRAYADRLEPRHIALIERLGPNAPQWPTAALIAPLVVVHGDFRLDNMMFGTTPQAPPIAILDWQATRLGPPLLDHSIFLGSCMSTEDRRAHEWDLLRSYHERLLAAGVTGFDWNDCIQSYRISALYPLLLTVSFSLLLGKTERDRDMWTQLLRGAADLVYDHDAGDLLASAPSRGH
jgi:hypothetical protein